MTTDLFDFLKRRFRTPELPVAAQKTAYRLRSWPPLHGNARTAEVLRMLSRMSMRPVSAKWFVRESGLAPAEGERLLKMLVEAHYIEAIDVASYGAARE